MNRKITVDEDTIIALAGQAVRVTDGHSVTSGCLTLRPGGSCIIDDRRMVFAWYEITSIDGPTVYVGPSVFTRNGQSVRAKIIVETVTDWATQCANEVLATAGDGLRYHGQDVTLSADEIELAKETWSKVTFKE